MTIASSFLLLPAALRILVSIVSVILDVRLRNQNPDRKPGLTRSDQAENQDWSRLAYPMRSILSLQISLGIYKLCTSILFDFLQMIKKATHSNPDRRR